MPLSGQRQFASARVLSRRQFDAMTQYIQVVTTTGSREDAERIAKMLVERRLAACVQISGPITSTYRWEGAIETASEYQCTAKSRLDLFAQLEQAIREIHPYQTPEILATQIFAGSAAYLGWLDAELQPPA
jgi:periplasmic divalent cation tolerance protein